MKKTKRITAMLLCILMLVAAVPVTTVSALDVSNVITINETTPADIWLEAADAPYDVARFTPAESGEYEFLCTHFMQEIYMKVYSDPDIEPIISQDSPFVGSNDVELVVKCTLQAGATYYVEVGSDHVVTPFGFGLYVRKYQAAPTIKSVEISRYPYSLDYYDFNMGEHYPFGLQVKATFTDNSERYFDFGNWYGDYNFDGVTIGCTKGEENYGLVTVTFAGFEVSYRLNIEDPEIDGLEYIGDGLTITEFTHYQSTGGIDGYYDYYQLLEDQGEVFEITFKNGTKKKCSLWEIDFLGVGIDVQDGQDTYPWAAGENYEIIIDYFGFEAVVPVTITETPVKNITITKKPSYKFKYGDLATGYFFDEESYIVNAATHYDDLEFTVEMKDGEIRKFKGEDIDKRNKSLAGDWCNIYCNMMIPDEIGEKLVTLNYCGFLVDYYVDIVESNVKSISFSKQPDNKTYSDYFMPTFAGAQIKVEYNNGSFETIDVTKDNICLDGGNSLTIFNDAKEGVAGIYQNEDENFVLYAYGLEEAYDFMNYVPREYTDIEITNLNTNFKNMTLVATGANGKESFKLADDVDVSYGGFGGPDIIPHVFYTDTPYGVMEVMVIANIDINRMVTSYDIDALGCMDTITVNEDAELVGIKVIKRPDIVRYSAGEEFDPTGLKLRLSYDNGATSEIYYGGEAEINVGEVDTSLAGKKTVTVEYSGKATTFEIEVDAVFNDVAEDSWYSDAVEYASKYGLINGTGDGNFAPNSDITRAQFVMIIAQMEGIDLANYEYVPCFNDVAENMWYTTAVYWAQDNGIVSGDGNGSFNPDGKITREQMCVILKNYVEKYHGSEFKKAEVGQPFTDDASISGWAKDAVAKCQRADIINGIGDGSFGPSKFAQRSQGAVIFAKFHKERPYN